jgi:Cu-Zn family superoxide dismutase
VRFAIVSRNNNSKRRQPPQFHKPTGKTHGAPSDDAGLKMEGDLGNLTADVSGVATIKMDDSKIKVFGPHSVIGRSVVICAGADDEGRGGQENSTATGNAGPRIAFGVIGLGNPSSA